MRSVDTKNTAITESRQRITLQRTGSGTEIYGPEDIHVMWQMGSILDETV